MRKKNVHGLGSSLEQTNWEMQEYRNHEINFSCLLLSYGCLDASQPVKYMNLDRFDFAVFG